jgi:hypothetical protein
MDFEQILEAINELPPKDLERLKEILKEREQIGQSPDVDQWLSRFQAIAAEFRGDSSSEEMQQIVAAMTLKSPPTDKGAT